MSPCHQHRCTVTVRRNARDLLYVPRTVAESSCRVSAAVKRLASERVLIVTGRSEGHYACLGSGPDRRAWTSGRRDDRTVRHHYTTLHHRSALRSTVPSRSSRSQPLNDAFCHLASTPWRLDDLLLYQCRHQHFLSPSASLYCMKCPVAREDIESY